MADNSQQLEDSGAGEDDNRFATDAPPTPLAVPPPPLHFSSDATRKIFDEIAENEALIEREGALNRRIHGVFAQLDNFGKIADDPNFDARAYEALRAVSAGTLEPLSQLLGQRAGLRTELLTFKAQQRAAAKAQTELQQQLREMTAARDTLQQAAQHAQRAELVQRDRVGDADEQTPLRFGAAFSPGSGMSQATTMTLPSAAVMIQGHTKSLSVPLTSGMVRSFHVYMMQEIREGRPVRRAALITPSAEQQISIRFRSLAEQPGFDPAYPNGATRTEDMQLLDSYVADPSDCGLQRYVGAVCDAQQQAQPANGGSEKECVRLLHKHLTGFHPETASQTIKDKLTKRFAGSLPATIALYLVAVDSEYQRAVKANALANEYLGYGGGRIPKKRAFEGEPDNSGGRGGGQHGGRGFARDAGRGAGRGHGGRGSGGGNGDPKSAKTDDLCTG
ncbi:hypothetical protein B484DRAFT_438828, partial [Ochromonadaceae sp. CCMP2298]